MGQGVSRLYQLMDRSPLRVLSLVAALLLAGCIFQDPARFAANSGHLAIWQGLMLIWAVCSGMIHGVGFSPRRLRWQRVFAPLPALILLLCGIVFFYS